jgi:hypothetical protein
MFTFYEYGSQIDECTPHNDEVYGVELLRETTCFCPGIFLQNAAICYYSFEHHT